MKGKTSIVLALLVISTFLGFSKNVLIESFTATWCGPCKTYDPVVNDMYDADSELVLVHYHVDNDGYDFNWTNSRKNWYGVPGIPTFIFDGVLKQVGGSPAIYMNFRKMIAERKALQTPGEVVISATYENGAIRYTLYPSQLIKNIQMIALIIEDQVTENGETLRNVVRAAKTVPMGEIRSQLSESVQFTLDPKWNRSKLSGVIIVQQMFNKEILGVEQTHRP